MELEKQSKLDVLTGLFNKHATEELIRAIVPDLDPERDLCALIMIDADDFKRINDTFGHAVGDQVLSQIGSILRSHVRMMDVAGRVGGDEFMILMRNVASVDASARIAERILAQVKDTFERDPDAPNLSLSAGIALYPQNGTDFDSLYSAADHALYESKRHGKGIVRFSL